MFINSTKNVIRDTILLITHYNEHTLHFILKLWHNIHAKYTHLVEIHALYYF